MKHIVGVAVVSVLAIPASSIWLGGVSDTPTIPASITPVNGSLVEYWPNKQVRSESVYRNDKVQAATYYSSDGTVIFEMTSDDG